MTKSDSAEYYRGRERAEREAAANAACPEAQRAHAKMAEAYARLHAGDGSASADGVPPA